MKNEILSKKEVGRGIFRFEIEEARIAAKHRPGQFVILMAGETGERIPLTIADSNPERGTITVVFQVVGKSTALLSSLGEGDRVPNVIGPLGRPTPIERYGRVACVIGGVGAPYVYPILKALKEKGNELSVFLGTRSRDLLVMEKELEEISDAFSVSTDDGTYGVKGTVVDLFREALGAGERFDMAVVVGPVGMMEATCSVTEDAGIRTIVSLNTIMVDGTGMCGSCRVTVGDESKLVCCDGPEFDGHLVDWAELRHRLGRFEEQEKVSMELYEKQGKSGKTGKSTERR